PPNIRMVGNSESPQLMDRIDKRPKADKHGVRAGETGGNPVGKTLKADMSENRNESHEEGRSYLDGQLLIAMPVMPDERFARAVIYVCAHSSEGAMGIILNRPAGSIDFPELLVQLDIIDRPDQIVLPAHAETMKVMKGGPVETGRGFVLHSSDFFIKDATLP